MAYNHLTIKELIWIEQYYKSGEKVANIAKYLSRARQTIYNVINWLKKGSTIQEYYDSYKKNKSKCGAKIKQLSDEEYDYVLDKVNKGWTPDVIIGRGEIKLSMSSRTLYRRFKDGSLDKKLLPMKGKRKKNGSVEKRGKQAFKRSIHSRNKSYPNFKNEFGHFEGDTIVGKNHKSCVITLVERVSKAIITLKPENRTAKAIENRLNSWLDQIPKHLVKSITFDCGKEFSNWKSVCNKHDISIFFADPGCPSQRGLNENSNGLLRKDGLPKQTDFRLKSETDIVSVASYRNNIPRKSLNYKTPLEEFMNLVYSV
ncbi:IS30 family transposase [Anaerococcus marasmi]|uniref:IS30 family transposase n=1 Tax=Anaerococcus marasmi TaxID=2057797 RepID=UPI000CFA5748|nr:IS30 family transposase [Anaerococcus marasmi]